MAIRKVLLPLQLATTAAATFSAAVMVARTWRARLAVIYTAAHRDRECTVRGVFDRLTAEHGLAVAEARPDAEEAMASLAVIIGREPHIAIAHQARLCGRNPRHAFLTDSRIWRLIESLRDRHQGAGHADGNDGAGLADHT